MRPIIRIEILQKIITLKRAKTYLEIGIGSGECFLQIRAVYKIAIDPEVRISNGMIIEFYLKNWSNFLNQYYQMASDSFFHSHGDFLHAQKIDVAFIDGLHTYAQSYRDVINCLKHLKDNGVIVLHDCNPASDDMAFPAESFRDFVKLRNQSSSASWCGDVWKTVVLLRSTRPDLNVFVLDGESGFAFITKRKSENMLHYSADDIQKLNYQNLASDRAHLLNLKEIEYFDHFCKSYSGAS